MFDYVAEADDVTNYDVRLLDPSGGRGGRYCTAREYLELYEPGVIDIMLDPDTALREDEDRASQVAADIGAQGTVLSPADGVFQYGFPEYVWAIVYPYQPPGGRN